MNLPSHPVAFWTRMRSFALLASLLISVGCDAQSGEPLPPRGACFTRYTGDMDGDLADEKNIHFRFAAFLASARRSIDLAMYRLDHDEVLSAVEDACKRGIAVRVHSDDDSLHHRYVAAFSRLRQAGAEISVDSRNPFDWAVHHKVAVVDGRRVWAGDWNASVADTVHAHHAAYFVESPELAAVFVAEFERLMRGPHWEEEPVVGAPVERDPARLESGGIAEAHFGNQENLVTVACAAIAEARSEIRLAHTELNSWAVVDALVRAALRGVKVRVAFSNTNATMRYTDALARFGGEARRAKRTEGAFIGFKFFLVDEATLVTGSWNMLNHTPNMENLVVLRDVPDLVKAYGAEFDRLFDRLPAYWQKPNAEAHRAREQILERLERGERTPLPTPSPSEVALMMFDTEFEEEGTAVRPILLATPPRFLLEERPTCHLLLAPAKTVQPGRRQAVVMYLAKLASSLGPILDPRHRPIILTSEMILSMGEGGCAFPYVFDSPMPAGHYKLEADVFEVDAQGRILHWLATYKLKQTLPCR